MPWSAMGAPTERDPEAAAKAEQEAHRGPATLGDRRRPLQAGRQWLPHPFSHEPFQLVQEERPRQDQPGAQSEQAG